MFIKQLVQARYTALLSKIWDIQQGGGNIGRQFQISLEYDFKSITAKYRYNAAYYIPVTERKRPMARPLGRDMGRLL